MVTRNLKLKQKFLSVYDLNKIIEAFVKKNLFLQKKIEISFQVFILPFEECKVVKIDIKLTS